MLNRDVLELIRAQRDKDEILKERFTAVRDILRAAVQISPNGIGQTESTDKVGFVMEGFDEAGNSIRELHLHPEHIHYATTKYTRWSETWPTVERVVQNVVPLLQKRDISLKGMLLQFEDLFEADYDEQMSWISELFAKESGLYPKVIDEHCPNAWHSYSGFFEKPEGIPGRILTNINIVVKPKESVEPGLGHLISIQMNHRLDFDSPEEVTVENISQNMQLLHLQNKKYMIRLIAKEIREAILLES
ncbi:MAG: hypothetical protein K0S46_119 [Moraxellaceae bacterium]|jgi:uncharacterized protein (TIGR04255 family)|nr:hypothetical protein [Moraxellaceae bacterium]